MNMDDLHDAIHGLTQKKYSWVEDCVLIMLGDDTQIYLEYSREQDELYLYSHIASIPPERFGRHAVKLLEGNLFGQATGGSAVLAYDSEECKVVLWDKLKLGDVTAEEFRERFSLLYLSRLHWADTMRRDILGGHLKAMEVYIG